MGSNKHLEEQLKLYQEAAKENKNVDVAALMLAALAKQEAHRVPVRTKRWAYFISLGAPPFGLLFALKYYFSDESDAKVVASICAVLTTVSLFSVWIFFNLIFSGTGAISPTQIQQIKPSDIIELTQ